MKVPVVVIPHLFVVAKLYNELTDVVKSISRRLLSGGSRESEGKITVTITDNSLHFHRDPNFWFKTTITLPAGKDPKQFHATIKDCPQADSIGEIVKAFFKIEGGILTRPPLVMVPTRR